MPPAVRRRRCAASGDEGVSLIEVIVALAIMGIVMVSAAAFFINSLHNGSLQTQRQAAVTLANQAIEAVQAVAPDKLLEGRTQGAVNALIATTGAAALTLQDVVTTSSASPETLNFDVAASAAGGETVKLESTQTEDGVPYLVRTFINVCWLDSAAGTCTRAKPAGAIAVYRATSSVTWTPGGGASCAAACAFAANTLVDKQGDPKFNSNISSPIISSVSPTPVAAGSTRALTIAGVSFKAGAIVTISAGGGSLGTVSNNTGTSLNVTLTAGGTPGSYVLSVVNLDGGRANYSLTITAPPTITSVAPASVANGASTGVTITGTGFQSGAVVTMTNGSVSSTTVTGATSIGTVLTPSGSTGTTTVTVTNPDGGVATAVVTVTASQPIITAGSQSGSAALVGSATQITLTGTGFSPTGTVGVPAGAGTVGSYTTRTSTSFVFAFTPAAANQSTTFTLTNPDGGAASRAVTVATVAPVITSSSQSSTSAVGTQISITLVGSNFSPSAATVSASTGSMGSITSPGASSYTFTYTPTAANQSVTFTLVNPSPGGSATHTRTVTTSAVTPPTITSGTQSGAKAWLGSATQVTLSGSAFSTTAVVTVSGGGAGTVGTYPTRTATSIVFNYTPTTPGATTFTVTNPDGGAASVAVTILVKPKITNVTSSNTTKNQSTVITVTGTGFLTDGSVRVTTSGTVYTPATASTTVLTINYTNIGTAGTYPVSSVATNAYGTGTAVASDAYSWNYVVTN